jgi:hypothetical protein
LFRKPGPFKRKMGRGPREDQGDCSSFFPPEVDGAAIHGAYFVNDGTLKLIRHVLRGLDRGVLDTLGYTKGTAWP